MAILPDDGFDLISRRARAYGGYRQKPSGDQPRATCGVMNRGSISALAMSAIDAGFFAGTACRTNFFPMRGCGDPETILARLPRLDVAEVNRIV